jgi:uncharacterized phage protein (TIGR02218 family)
MRAIDPVLQARLDSGVTTLCRCWLLMRSDGARMGFTDHDEDVGFGGDIFAAATGMTGSALQVSGGLSVDNSQVAGALSSAGIAEVDVAAGRYDGAQIEHWLVDWSDPLLRALLFAGRLGEVRRGSLGYEVELRGLSEDLNRVTGRAYLRECDAVLGDGRCGVDTGDPAFAATGTVSEVRGAGSFVATGLGAFAAGWFARGRLEWLTGANAGTIGQVRLDIGPGVGRLVETWEEMAAAMVPGDQFRIVAGCDKRAETCRTKFGNFINYRGFPHIPGEDWVNGYVRQGGRHDGSSLFG